MMYINVYMYVYTVYVCVLHVWRYRSIWWSCTDSLLWGWIHTTDQIILMLLHPLFVSSTLCVEWLPFSWIHIHCLVASLQEQLNKGLVNKEWFIVLACYLHRQMRLHVLSSPGVIQHHHPNHWFMDCEVCPVQRGSDPISVSSEDHQGPQRQTPPGNVARCGLQGSSYDTMGHPNWSFYL